MDLETHLRPIKCVSRDNTRVKRVIYKRLTLGTKGETGMAANGGDQEQPRHYGNVDQ